MQRVSPEHPEYASILEQLPALASTLRTRLITKGVKPADYTELRANILSHATGQGTDYSLVTAGPCIVGYNVIQPWWAEGSALAEEFIIRYKPGDFSDTIKELEKHARELGCADLVIASLAMIRQESYGECLQRKGFREIARQYIKEIQWAQ